MTRSRASIPTIALGSSLLAPVGFAVVGPLGAAVGLSTALIGAAALVVVTTALVLLSRDLRALERRAASPC